MSSKACAVNRDDFRVACGRYATGIAVATVMGTDGAPHGLTVNSFTSVSLSPPLILLCVAHSSAVLEYFRATPFFAINILREEQRALSGHFARTGHDRFEGVSWTAGISGAPLLPGSLAVLQCEMHKRVVAGDHDILIGEVRALEIADSRPLVYYASSYRQLSEA